jgi:hypothetical protein
MTPPGTQSAPTGTGASSLGWMSVGHAFRSLVRRRLGVVILVACVVAVAGGGPGASAATTGVELGSPNVTGYCQSMGFTGAGYTHSLPVQYVCSGATSPLDTQAACEFTFTQRPIRAEEIVPNLVSTLNCFQTSSAGGGSPGAGGTHRVTPAKVRASLLAALLPNGRGAKIAALLRKGGYSARFVAPSTGSVVLSWYFVPKGAHVARGAPQPTLVATGRASFSRAGATHVMIRLTAGGRRLLKHARRLKLTGKGTFSESGFAPVIQRATFTLKQ